jgi:hypothetical protein
MKKNNIHNKAGFQVPDGYFDQLTDRVLENGCDQKGVEHAGFKTPDDYFSSFEDRVMAQVTEETKVIPLHSSNKKTWLYPLLAVAALFIGFVAIQGMFSDSEVTFADVGDQELRDYIAGSNFLQDEESIDILYADNSILNTMEIEDNITDSELFEYLMEDTTLNQMIKE